MNDNKKLIELKNLVEAAEISLQQARKIMIGLIGTKEEKTLQAEAQKTGTISATGEGQVIEGLFDGQNMVGPDGKKYSVPANYASKSKLVEGDNLKLTITPDGSFVYKQIHLLERDRIIGELIIDDETNEYRVLANNKSYKILTASVTYFKGEPGNKVTILVPKGKESTWAAVENIFKEGEGVSGEARTATDGAGGEQSKIEQELKGSDENRDEKSDEFLSQDNDKSQADEAQASDHETDEAGAFNKFTGEEAEHFSTDKTEKPKPDDIFKATQEVDVDDVEQVNIESHGGEPASEKAQPPSVEQATAGLINQEDENKQTDNKEADDLGSRDSQGLEEI